LSDDDLIRYTASADVYVSTSLSDAGLAASTAEAMACAVPTIITDFGDNHKWIKSGENGFLFPLKDNNTLADRIVYLLKNPDIAKKVGKSGRVTINEKNNFQKEMAKIDSYYKDLIDQFRSK
ncbi:MAG TPA: glycosyltransferase, partial [Candidatus Dependentiae bacterium]|nr:glycosyltransferase [Candidatus Dependentiae bacterium]